MDAIAVAILTGVSGGKVAGGITATMAGAATAGVTIAGTTAGVGTAGVQVTGARGASVTLAGIIATTVADGTDGTITGGGIIDPTIDARAETGPATLAGGETSRFQRNTENRAR